MSASGDAVRPPVLLLGQGGMLWRAWRQQLDEADIACHSPDLSQLDFTVARTVDAAFATRFGTVINCAAWTDVDRAEAHEPEAYVLNATAPAMLANQCARSGALLVHYSTDYVFNGRASRPYAVDAPIEPANAYGRTKAAGEKLIADSGCRHLIIRTSGLYAPWGRNFVRTMARLMNARPVLRVVDDQTTRVTSAEYLAAASMKLTAGGAAGTYHVAGGGTCSWCEFAQAIAQLLKSGCQIQPCTTAEYPTPATRPPYSVLDLSKAEMLIGPTPDWRAQLEDVVRRLEN